MNYWSGGPLTFHFRATAPNSIQANRWATATETTAMMARPSTPRTQPILGAKTTIRLTCRMKGSAGAHFYGAGTRTEDVRPTARGN